jgi:hypothetical protein
LRFLDTNCGSYCMIVLNEHELEGEDEDDHEYKDGIEESG